METGSSTRPKRRRRRAAVYVEPVPPAAPTPAPVNTRQFNITSLINLFAIPALTGLFVIGGFYYVSKDVQNRHELRLDKLDDVVKTKADEETKAREKVREEFLRSQRDTTAILGKLETHAAVQDVAQKTMNDQLGKIADQLQQINSGVRSRK